MRPWPPRCPRRRDAPPRAAVVRAHAAELGDDLAGHGHQEAAFPELRLGHLLVVLRQPPGPPRSGCQRPAARRRRSTWTASEGTARRRPGSARSPRTGCRRSRAPSRRPAASSRSRLAKIPPRPSRTRSPARSAGRGRRSAPRRPPAHRCGSQQPGVALLDGRRLGLQQQLRRRVVRRQRDGRLGAVLPERPILGDDPHLVRTVGSDCVSTSTWLPAVSGLSSIVASIGPAPASDRPALPA